MDAQIRKTHPLVVDFEAMRTRIKQSKESSAYEMNVSVAALNSWIYAGASPSRLAQEKLRTWLEAHANDTIQESEDIDPTVMTVSEFTHGRKALRLTQEQFAKKAGVARCTVAVWERSMMTVPRRAAAALRTLQQEHGATAERKEIDRLQYELDLQKKRYQALEDSYEALLRAAVKAGVDVSHVSRPSHAHVPSPTTKETGEINNPFSE